MQELIGNPYPAGWLQVAAALLHMIPMNILVGGAFIAAVASLSADETVVRLGNWIAGLMPAAGSRSPTELTLEEKIKEARRMKFEEGRSVRQIAPHFGVSPSTIHNWLHGYPYRDR